MKKIYKLFIVLLFSSILYAQNFSTVLTPYFQNSLNDIFFLNETNWMGVRNCDLFIILQTAVLLGPNKIPE